MSPAQVISNLRTDAAAADAANTNGFSGDSNSSVPGKYFGYLIYAGAY